MKSLQLKKHKNRVNQCSSVSDMGSVNPCLTLFSVSFASFPPKKTQKSATFSNFFQLFPNFLRLYPLIYNPFMRNKANFKNPQMSVTSFVINSYEEYRLDRPQKTKPNKANSKPISKTPKIKRNPISNNHLQQKSHLRAKKNKPKTNPISKTAKNERNLIYNKGLQQKWPCPRKKTKPIQTQFQTKERNIEV